MSQDFHTAVFRIKQTGVLYVDATDQPLSEPELTACLKNAQTVFCQVASNQLLMEVATHFGGNKVVLCAGELTSVGVNILLTMLETADRTAPLSVHFGAGLRLPYSGIEEVVRLISNNRAVVMEVSVDIACFRGLGACVLVAALKNNLSLQSLLISNPTPTYSTGANSNCSPWLSCMTSCVRRLAHNYTLRELRLIGGPLDRASIFELHTSLSYGLDALRVLEFGLDDRKAQGRADAIVEVGKAKASIGKGISVTVNESIVREEGESRFDYLLLR